MASIHPEKKTLEKRTGIWPGVNEAEIRKITQAGLSVFSITNPNKAGWSSGCASTLDSRGRTIFADDAHRYGQRNSLGL